MNSACMNISSYINRSWWFVWRSCFNQTRCLSERNYYSWRRLRSDGDWWRPIWSLTEGK